MILQLQHVKAYITTFKNRRKNYKRYDLKFILKEANITSLKKWRKTKNVTI